MKMRTTNAPIHLCPFRWVALFETCLILLFIILGSVGLFHHELWRDETQAWLLARDSSSVLDLFRNAHYEGHPLLWHYCLYVISRLSRSVIAMQSFNLLLAIGSVWLIVKKSPFPLLQRSLLVFGYFTFYEYALLSRSYGLGVFLTFLFCAVYCDRRLLSRWQAWLLTIILVLLANTSILGLVISGVLAIALYSRLFIASESKARQSLGSILFILLAGWLVSAFQIGRSLFNPMGLEGFDADARAATVDNPTAQAVIQQTAESAFLSDWIENTDKLLQIFLKSHVPLPVFRFHFWNEHPLQSDALHTPAGWLLLLLSVFLVIAVIFLAFQLLRKAPIFLFLYGLGTLSMIAIFVFAYRGAARHHGHLFILFLACLWLAQWSQQAMNQTTSPINPRPAAPKLFSLLLCVHVFAGIYAYTSDLLYPFSASYQTARIVETQLDSLPILAINQRPISPISGYIDRPLFYPEAEKFGSFWDISYPEILDEKKIAEEIKAFSANHAEFLAVLTLPLSEQLLFNALDVQYLAFVGPSIVEDEAFYLYRISQSF